jgi:hypothetical protein
MASSFPEREEGKGKVLHDLENRQCRWPYGPVAQTARFFCGDPTDPGRIYCPVHDVLAWRPR